MNPLPWFGTFSVGWPAYAVVVVTATLVIAPIAFIGPRGKKASTILGACLLSQVYMMDGYGLTNVLPYWAAVFLGAVLPVAGSALGCYGLGREKRYEPLIPKNYETPLLMRRRQQIEREVEEKLETSKDRSFDGIDGKHRLLPPDFPKMGQPSALQKQIEYLKKNHPDLLERVAE